MRSAQVARKTGETDVKLSLNLDGTGKHDMKTGCGFLDHMLSLLSNHSMIDIDIACVGDLDVDFHHTTEDTAIALGEAFCKALGNKEGITRFADSMVPMDESLTLVALDISGRGFLDFDCEIGKDKVGDFDTELVEEFWSAFARTAKVTLHIRKICGTNSHHIIESVFKSCAVALRKAVSIDPARKNRIPSTKGVL